MTAQHTPGPLTVRMEGTCSGAWAEIGQECIDPVTQEPWWRELARTSTTHIERTSARGRRLPGPVGTIDEKPHRFELTEDGAEHIANAHLWAAASEMLDTLRTARAYIQASRDSVADSHRNPATGRLHPANVCAADDALLRTVDAAIAKATGGAS